MGLTNCSPAPFLTHSTKHSSYPSRNVTKHYGLVLANYRSYFVEIQRSNSMAGRSRPAFTPRDPAVAAHGLRFYCAPQYRQNIRNDVHLKMNHKKSNQERPRLIPARLKDVPHFVFARVEGADLITLHIFFPHLSYQYDFRRLTDEQLSRWFDHIFYPAVRRVCGPDRLQHLPASYRHALATCRAPQVEDRLLETSSYQSPLRLSYFLPPQCLHQLWSHILVAVTQPGLQDFRDPELFVEAKGTKLRFKSPNTPTDLLMVMENFECELRHILDFAHVRHERLYVDVGKETCPPSSSVREHDQGSPLQEAQTYLWRRCCLKHHLRELYDGSVPKSGQNFYHESMLRDAGSMTTLTPPSSRLRRGGLLYGQMYNLTKEIIDAARTFPFQNPDLRLLALDPGLRDSVQNIRKKSIWSKSITERAYLASKRRCHSGLMNSQQRSFGVREEYRISWVLFQSILSILRAIPITHQHRNLQAQPSCVWAVRTPSFIHFLWDNINKFTTGFEFARAECSGALISWEQTKVMDMFLRCLQVAVGGHDYSREVSLWWSRRKLQTPTKPLYVRYGLGFSQTLEQYRYCWLEPRIDWNQLKFITEISESVLFGLGTLQKRYLECGGHVRHFFDASRRADLGFEWLRKHGDCDVLANRILSWLIHLCLQQMRIDVLRTIRRDIRPEIHSTMLEDTVQFCHKGLSAILLCGLVAVSGQRTPYKTPLDAAWALFEHDDGQLRENWENKPFRKLYYRIYNTLKQLPAEQRLLDAFLYRFHRYIFAYHWALPYPTHKELAPRSKAGARRWVSINSYASSRDSSIESRLDD